MANSSDSVLEAALALGEAERVRIVEKLIQSLGGAGQAEIDSAWAAEAELRLQAYRDGKIQSFSADEVFASLLSKDAA
jgi:putative addiction module component (TIGR02574 family)